MYVNYDFVPSYKSIEIKQRSDIISYAGKLLEILDSPTVVITLNEDLQPLVYSCSDSLVNALDFSCDTY